MVEFTQPSNIQYIIADINSAYISGIVAQFIGGSIQIINTSSGPITVSENSLGLVSSAALANLDTSGVWMPFNTAATTSVSYRNLQFFAEGPTNKTYPLLQSAGFAFTINNIIAVTGTGTINVTVTINSTPVTGLDELAISDVQTTFRATANNVVDVGDTVAIVTDSASSASDLSITITYSYDE